MKKIFFSLSLGAALLGLACVQSCETLDPCSTLECENGGYCSSGECNCTSDFYGPHCEFRYTGDVSFWTNVTTYGFGHIYIYVEGSYLGSLTKYYDSTPDCSYASDVVRFTGVPGTYNYSAISDDGHTWSGTFTIQADLCTTFLLYSNAGAKGNAMFWTNRDLGCGYVTVNVAGQTGTISSYYSSGPPACASAGCATFNLSPGTYSFTASCTGKSWSGNVVVSAGGCYTMRLDP